MPNWHDPAEIQRDIQIFAKSLLFWLGVYVWEYLNSLGPDLDILLARRPFRPAQLVYFACRYANLAFLIGTNIAMEVSHPINCRALYIFDTLTLGVVLGTSSGLLMLRTAVVWGYDKRVVIPLIICSLGHWAVILRDIVVVHASWNPPAHTCAVDEVFNYWLAVEFIYTMVLDFIILCLTTIGLFRCLPIKSKLDCCNTIRSKAYTRFPCGLFPQSCAGHECPPSKEFIGHAIHFLS
ncbi:uncharacterized protein EI90DRAFT_1333018 [Cantharellus anzutake]|uniref:uncharacterized protein n=1 Tax=Cantharellus anzutake TaxID=1750568 RepID=UPI0019048A0D|nr:uncharacterized protein EI90DRAFT_1333018 [Cantharellus anzutake]KAF8342351.1 hypothetical protein EI90DRAFT_1333018 [Cantharellus anzutake]